MDSHAFFLLVTRTPERPPAKVARNYGGRRCEWFCLHLGVVANGWRFLVVFLGDGTVGIGWFVDKICTSTDV